MDPASFQLVGAVAARLLARPILQEYDAFTVDELTWIAARHNLVEIAEACRKEADACTMDGMRNCYGNRQDNS